jgi:DNA polymerase III epsilon subunit-like protein
MKYPTKYVVLDFETSGLDHKTDKILEIGAMKVDMFSSASPGEEFTTLINWNIPIPPEVTKINGITQEMCLGKMQPDKAKEALKAFIGNLPIVGHNVYNFDFKFLDKFLELTHYDWDNLMNNFIDTAVMMKARKMKEDRAWNETYKDFAERIMSQRIFGVKYSLGVCCDELGIPKPDGQHRAMADVKLTNELYNKICLYPENGLS